MDPFIITGAPVAGGDPPCRLEINDFVKDVKMFSLYIQALVKMQAEDQDHLTSQFQVSGIHGMPYKSWNDVGSGQQGTWGGYCTHNTTLFPTWHRPYVALFEQILQDHAAKIAEKYTTDALDWKDAAANLRQPYWDWAKNSVPPKEVISCEKVKVILPDGPADGTDIDNPLLGYRFHPGPDPSFLPPYKTWPKTVRHPTTADPSTESDVQRLKTALKGEQTCLKESTYNMLTNVRSWALFSHSSAQEHEGYKKFGRLFNSLEAIHDTVHVKVGGAVPDTDIRGDMAADELAGFDPIFFLHHAQVDRLLSLWSAIHPDVWVAPGTSGTGDMGGTWTIPDNTTLDGNTGLTPFFNPTVKFWTSAQIQSCIAMGYNYPEFKGLDLNDTEAVQKIILDYVGRTYGPTTKTISREISDDLVNGIWEWVATVRVQKFAVGGSFSVLFFLGYVPEDPSAWITSPSYVGSYSVFANGAREGCSNCMSNEELVVEGSVHLQQNIASRSRLSSFDPEVVEPYLTNNISWRVLVGDKVVPAEEIPSLQVRIVAARSTLLPGTLFPDFGEPRIFHGITARLPGGSYGPKERA